LGVQERAILVVQQKKKGSAQAGGGGSLVRNLRKFPYFVSIVVISRARSSILKLDTSRGGEVANGRRGKHLSLGGGESFSLELEPKYASDKCLGESLLRRLKEERRLSTKIIRRKYRGAEKKGLA